MNKKLIWKEIPMVVQDVVPVFAAMMAVIQLECH